MHEKTIWRDCKNSKILRFSWFSVLFEIFAQLIFFKFFRDWKFLDSLYEPYRQWLGWQFTGGSKWLVEQMSFYARCSEQNRRDRNWRSTGRRDDLWQAVFEIDFWKTFDNSFLPKIKLRLVELKILSTDVLKYEKGSHDFSAVVLLGVENMKTLEKIDLF